MNERQLQRRQFMKFACTSFAMMPAMIVSGRSLAATNATMRAALKYQGKSEGDKSCANCMQFVPGPSAKDLGGCKILPGDTEISPQGYCLGWIKKT